MGEKLGTFDFRKLNVILGATQITGFADGDSLIVEEDNPAFNTAPGADGHVDRVKNNANSLTITCSLRQTSPTNQLLSALHAADRAASATLPLMIKDRNGTTLIFAKDAWIERFSKAAFGNEAKTREWVIKTGSQYTVNLGGNN
jgi:hypothetical protein